MEDGIRAIRRSPPSETPCTIPSPVFPPSKAFNPAGIQIANIVAADEEVRKKVDKAISINEVCDVNSFAVDAWKRLITEEDWLGGTETLPLQELRDCPGYAGRERLPQLRVPCVGRERTWSG